jgi:hypothetical protein
MQKKMITRIVPVLFFLLLPVAGWAEPTTADQASQVVRSWLRLDRQPLATRLGSVDGFSGEEVKTFTDDQGQPLYHIVSLQPDGFVIVAGDDLVEPIIGFVARGSYDPSPDNPLGALVSIDLPGRVNRVREFQSRGLNSINTPVRKGLDNARQKWADLEQNIPAASLQAMAAAVTDARVDPLLQSNWGQTEEDGGNNCYNYYTPSHYPAGCVATAMSQVMRYFGYPTTSVGTPAYSIKVDGTDQNETLKGGNGTGGAYHWDVMDAGPAVPVSSHRQAIGVLTHDTGVSLNMSYTAGGSSSDTLRVANRLKNPFGYSNAKKGYNSVNNIPAQQRNAMTNPNLDAGYPVLYGIRRQDPDTGHWYGHAIVCDGYGYNINTMYHHLNMGWSGIDNAWYTLPIIDAETADRTYTTVYKVVYNIYPAGTGEIISGRVVDAGGNPLAGVTVTAVRTVGGSYSGVTNNRGIYAIPKVLSGSEYTVSMSKTGYTAASQRVVTGTSQDNSVTVGNKWGINFTAQDSSDLVVINPGVSAAVLSPSQSFTINATVQNQGAALAAGTILRYYRSTDSIISTADTLLTTDAVGALASGATSAQSGMSVAPGVEGSYWVGACVDPVSNESPTDNQCSAGVEITVIRQPDLTVISPTVDDAGLTTGQTFTLSATAKNQGQGTAAGTTMRYYLSTDATISSSDSELGTDGVGSLAAAAESAQSSQFSAPATEGNYWLGACVDAVANESDTGNQCSVGVPIVVDNHSDLVVVNPAADDTTLTPGQVFTLYATAENQGNAAAADTTMRFYRSLDSVISTGDTELASLPIASLASGETSNQNILSHAPASEGTYWLGACVDAVANESDTGNQCSVGVEITVAAAPALPTVTTQSVTGIRKDQAIGHGAVTALGNPDPDQHGVCWNTQGNPTVADSCSQQGAVLATGTFSSTMTGLTVKTTYYVRAYATNSAGTAYGSEVSFVAGSSRTMPWLMMLLLSD